MDSSDGSFSITVASVTIQPEMISFGEVMIGEAGMDTVRLTNSGTATLVVTSVVTGSNVFSPGRTSFTLAPGESDTLSVWFVPKAMTVYHDTLILTTNDPAGDREIPLSGTGSSTLDVGSDAEQLPREFVLEQNYPNPFNPVTGIRYGVPRQGLVRLRVYTALGEEVATLVDEIQEAGWYTVEFGGGKIGGETLASGLYLYRLETGSSVLTRKMLLLK
jgi:hypothetical protein